MIKIDKCTYEYFENEWTTTTPKWMEAQDGALFYSICLCGEVVPSVKKKVIKTVKECVDGKTNAAHAVAFISYSRKDLLINIAGHSDCDQINFRSHGRHPSQKFSAICEIPGKSRREEQICGVIHVDIHKNSDGREIKKAVAIEGRIYVRETDLAYQNLPDTEYTIELA